MEEIAMKTLGYYNGKFGELDEMPVTKQELKDLLQEMVNKMDTGNLFVYYQLTRGTGIRNHVFTEGPGNLWIMLKPAEISDGMKPIKLISTEDTRFFHCNIKTLNLIPSVMAAEKAKKAGKKVGVTTSVSVDHATPAAFYAHQPDRNMYYEIALDLPKANFDFYAGGGFLKPTTTFDNKKAPSIFPIFEEAGYTVARGYNDYKAKSQNAEKMILIQEEGANPSCLPYAIDRKDNDLTLAQITESAIDFLTKGKNKGFFLMVEGGKIDWACHANDAATVFNEVKDMDNAIKVAYEFYKKHPKETLIVVTADHETGGIVLGTGKYALNLKALQHQKHSADGLSKRISELRKSKGNKVTWEDMKTFLGEEMGFWKQFPISWEQEKKLRDEFEKSFIKNKVVFAESMYSKSEPMAACAKEVMDEISMVGWVSGGHSAGFVPVFAIGAGSHLFSEKIDNTEIPKRIAKAAGYK